MEERRISNYLFVLDQIFKYIDPDFKNWGLDAPSSATLEMPVIVREMIRDGDFKAIFSELGDISLLCHTQGQIVDFVCLHSKWLRTDGYGTFFLFEKDNAFFVAYVYPDSGGRLKVGVYQFLFSFVWRVEYRTLFVIPQLTL